MEQGGGSSGMSQLPLVFKDPVCGLAGRQPGTRAPGVCPATAVATTLSTGRFSKLMFSQKETIHTVLPASSKAP